MCFLWDSIFWENKGVIRVYGGTRCLAAKPFWQCIQIFGNNNITNVTVVCIWCPEWFPEWFPVSIFLIFCVSYFLDVPLRHPSSLNDSRDAGYKWDVQDAGGSFWIARQLHSSRFILACPVRSSVTPQPR